MSLSDKTEYYVEIELLYDDRNPESERYYYKNEEELHKGYIGFCIWAHREIRWFFCRSMLVTSVIYDRSNYKILVQKFAFSGNGKTLDSDEEIIKKINSSWKNEITEKIKEGKHESL